ncbi:transposase, partial [Holospora curviuscula]|uniref:transposase n=1 Tax=Holospora curviuscula TaxID=1082868 RepID=UPI001A9C88CD
TLLSIKVKLYGKIIKDVGHTLLYLPPYSPDLNPIEKQRAQAKRVRCSTHCSIDALLFTTVL